MFCVNYHSHERFKIFVTNPELMLARNLLLLLESIVNIVTVERTNFNCV